jgi:hypothetical protein
MQKGSSVLEVEMRARERERGARATVGFIEEDNPPEIPDSLFSRADNSISKRKYPGLYSAVLLAL